MKICLRKYRIVEDNYNGYEVQKWVWYYPFWYQIGNGKYSINSNKSIKAAENLIELDKTKTKNKPIVVKTYECD